MAYNGKTKVKKKKLKGNETFNYNIRKLQNATEFTLFVTKVIISSMAFPLPKGFQAFFHPTMESLCNRNYLVCCIVMHTREFIEVVQCVHDSVPSAKELYMIFA